MAPPSSSATSTQLPLGLLAWLLRHRAETSWSAGTPLLTCIFLPFSQYWEKEPNAIGCARPLTPSAPCSLTEQMHLHEYVQIKLADATGKRKVHADGDFASEYESPPSAAGTPNQQEVHRTSSGYAKKPPGARYAPCSPPSARSSPPSARSSPRTMTPSSDLTSTNPVKPAASSRFSCALNFPLRRTVSTTRPGPACSRVSRATATASGAGTSASTRTAIASRDRCADSRSTIRSNPMENPQAGMSCPSDRPISLSYRPPPATDPLISGWMISKTWPG